jgi:septum formation topological specificity factor MinE
MTQEQKEYLKEMVKFRTLNPFDNEDYDNKELKDLRNNILELIKRYKELKTRIEVRKIEKQKIEELLKEIDSIPSSE